MSAPGVTAPLKRRKFIGGEPMKSATNMRGRPIVDFLRRAVLLDDALVHDRDLVGHRHGFQLVVRHVDGGGADAVVQRAQFAGTSDVRNSASSAPSGSSIRKALGSAHDRASERHALAVAAGEPRHRLVQQMIDAQQARRFVDASAAISAFGMPWHFSGKPMFWRTFMCG